MNKQLPIWMLLISIFLFVRPTYAQCVDASKVQAFTVNDKTYELIVAPKSWADAAACAVERGGYLAEVNTSTEQTIIYASIRNNEAIVLDETVSSDGGGASYVWLGGNDLGTEGKWIWDGNNDGTGDQFWQGDLNGEAVNDLYSNWGDEPDDFDGQDGLGLALTDWPLGVAGQWNDVDANNELYFVIEYDTPSGLQDDLLAQMIQVYPNPVSDRITISNQQLLPIEKVVLVNYLGQSIMQLSQADMPQTHLEVQDLDAGIYFVQVFTRDGRAMTKQVVKE